MECPACGFWKVNEFYGRKKCKRCGFVNKSMEELQDEKSKETNPLPPISYGK